MGMVVKFQLMKIHFTKMGITGTYQDYVYLSNYLIKNDNLPICPENVITDIRDEEAISDK